MLYTVRKARSMRHLFALVISHILLSTALLHAADPSSAQERMPPFSWERVPSYVHIRKDTAFTEDEIRYLASFPLVTIEKSTGFKDYKSTEEGTLVAARAVKKINPATKVLYYRNVIINYANYATNAALSEIPDAFLRGKDGSDKLVRNRDQAFDLTNAKVRDWWIASAKQVCADSSIDGIFLDGNVKVLEPGYLQKEIGERKKADLVDGYTAMMEETRRMLGPNKLMVANVLRARFPDSGMNRLRAFDGSYIEGFEMATGNVSAKDYMAKGISAFQEAARRGFLIAFTAGLGEENAKDDADNPEKTDEIRKSLADEELAKRRFQFVLAIFLICAEKHSYFYAHDGYNAKTSKMWMTHPPELDRPLGEPQGPAVRTGYAYTREFPNASVQLDLESHTGKITWK